MEDSTVQRIKKLLSDNNISEAELGRRIGMTRSSINQMIIGKRNVSANLIMGIAKEFPDVDIRYLITGEKEENPEMVGDKEISKFYNPLEAKDKQIQDLHDMIKQLISKIPDADVSQETTENKSLKYELTKTFPEENKKTGL